MRVYRRRVYGETTDSGRGGAIPLCVGDISTTHKVRSLTMVAGGREQKRKRNNEHNGSLDKRAYRRMGFRQKTEYRRYSQNKDATVRPYIQPSLGLCCRGRTGYRHKKLADGVRILLLHPNVATRDCGHCAEWLYDEETGQVNERGGQPVKRGIALTPCRLRGIGCAKGTPENPKTLSLKNRRTYQHYLECRATNHFPDDPIVRNHAVVIRMVEDSVARQHQEIDTIYLKAISRLPSLGV